MAHRPTGNGKYIAGAAGSGDSLGYLLVLCGSTADSEARVIQHGSLEHGHAVSIARRAGAVFAPTKRGVVSEVAIIHQIVSAGVGRFLQLHAVEIGCAGGAVSQSSRKAGDVTSGGVRERDLHAGPVGVGRDRRTAGNNVPGRHKDQLRTQPASAHASGFHISRERVGAIDRAIRSLRGVHTNSAAAGGAGDRQRFGADIARGSIGP